MKSILLIEDEENLNRGISLKLKKEGYAVFSATCVSEGLKLFQDNTIDLVICDIGLPDGSGLELCANIRQRSDVLFLLLTALDTEVDVITGYEMGADDYVTKPFSMSVLVSKISAMLKRTEKAVSNIVQTGKLTFYIDEKRVVKGDNAIPITPTDWKLLMASAINMLIIISNTIFSGVKVLSFNVIAFHTPFPRRTPSPAHS